MTFVVLESGTSTAVARRRLDAVGAITVVLVRRTALEGVTWHAFDPAGVAAAIDGAPDDAPLSGLITLDRMNEVPASDIADGSDRHPEGVVLDGHQVIAFSFPKLAAPSRAGATRNSGLRVDSPRAPSRSIDLPPLDMAAPPPAGDIPGSGLDDPPSAFTAHADIDAPTTVDRDEEFFVALGLSADPVTGTLGAGIWIEEIADDSPTLQLDVHLVGDFEVIDGGGAARTVEVDRTTLAHAPVAFRVKPGTPPPSLEPSQELWIGRVMMLFSYRGTPCGQSWREIRVSLTGKRADRLASERVPAAQGGSPIGPQTTPVPDLTMKLSRTPGNATSGLFSLVLTSPHFTDPVEPAAIELGDEPQTFSSQLIKQVNQHINDRISDELMTGVGLEIAEKLPDSFWQALQQVWTAVNSGQHRAIPNVLLLTDDPYVPWELAWMEAPLDETVPRFLGAQVNIGRWTIDADHIPTGTPLNIKGMAVLVGHYEDARGVAPLPSAAEEGEALAKVYNARALDATDRSVDQVLRGRLEDGGTFELEAIHFAGHGESDPEKNAAYVMLSDGSRLSDFVFRGPAIASEKQAFLFLNACQVGTAFGMLGEYAGVAGRAMRAGFRGFVAPLWSVADDKAKEISLGFYAASTEGQTVAEFFRSTRCKFEETETDDAHTTWLAYLFYGHPAMKLAGPQRRENPNEH